jgi:hypothetical protein
MTPALLLKDRPLATARDDSDVVKAVDVGSIKESPVPTEEIGVAFETIAMSVPEDVNEMP